MKNPSENLRSPFLSRRLKRRIAAPALATAVLFTAGLFPARAQDKAAPPKEALATGAPAEAAAEGEGLALSDFIALCWNLERLAYPEEGVTCKQFSSYDRSGPKANRDWGNYLRSSEEEGNVLAEMKGPGCVFRIWPANP